jgi:hypothetical protein
MAGAHLRLVPPPEEQEPPQDEAALLGDALVAIRRAAGCPSLRPSTTVRILRVAARQLERGLEICEIRNPGEGF